MAQMIEPGDRQEYRTAFIIGSPRSGTTLLGDILDLHPDISRWYEPYFILDYHFRNAPDDCRTATDVTQEVKEFLVRAFAYYQRKHKCRVVVDKSPRNSLKLPFLREIFPQARFIHILRDGRDTTLSIYKEWQKRQKILEHRGNFLQAFGTVKNSLARQPLWSHRISALHFEIGGLTNIFFKRYQFLHRIRWEGRAGWGPRFKGWQAVIDQISPLEFNAMQWARCVEAIIKARCEFDQHHFLEIRYENLLKYPEVTLRNIFTFLDVPFPEDFMLRLPALNETNYSKWQRAFSATEKAQIGPIIQPLLKQLGYAEDDSWYNCPDLKRLSEK